MKKRELSLTVLACVAAGTPIGLLLISTYVGLVTSGDKIEKMAAANTVMSFLMWFAFLPAVLLLIGTFVYSKKYMPRLWNVLSVGLIAGLLATVALDVVRLAGVSKGWIPFNMPPMMGNIITGISSEAPISKIVGYIYHFLIGAGFGMLYTLIVGRVYWLFAVLWAIVIEIGMMVGPPVLLVGGGFFGVNAGLSLFITTLIAHIAFGLVLGFIASRFVTDEKTIFTL